MFDPTPLYEAVLTGQATSARDVTGRALLAGLTPEDLLDRCLIPAMDEVGRRYECSDYFVPELLIASRAMKAALEVLRPALVAAGGRHAGRVAIGTVKGDLHDIGKSVVSAMLEGGGFDVLDLGMDVTSARFVAVARRADVAIVAMSCLLTTTMPAMRQVIAALAESGLRDRVKVIVGGAPVTEDYAAQIGADGFAPTAASAVALVRRLVAAPAGPLNSW